MSKVYLKCLMMVGIVLMFCGNALAENVYEAWVARYNGPANSQDIVLALAVDDSGNVYVTGGSIGSGSDWDYATIKYAPNGDTLWVRRYNGPGNTSDVASALAVDINGNVYVTGTSYDTLSYDTAVPYDYATIKYAPNGDTLWVRRYNGPGNSVDYAYALAVDTSGSVYVTGSSGTIKYSANGDSLWFGVYGGIDLVIDDSGNIYLTGGSGDYLTIKYAPNGDTLWVRRYRGGYAEALAVHDSGNVYVTGYSQDDYVTIKYSPCPVPGDANASGDLTLSDVIAVVNFIFAKPGFPDCYSNNELCWLSDLLCRGDWNGNSIVTLSDAIWGVNYIFNKPGGPWNPVPYGPCCD